MLLINFTNVFYDIIKGGMLFPSIIPTAQISFLNPYL